MKHPIIARMTWPDLMEKARNIKPVPRAMTDRLADMAREIGPCGVLAQIANGELYAD